MTKNIELPLRIGYKYGNIKDAYNRIIIHALQSANETRIDQFNSDAEFIVNSINNSENIRYALENLLEVFDRCEKGFAPEVELRFIAKDLAVSALAEADSSHLCNIVG